MTRSAAIVLSGALILARGMSAQQDTAGAAPLEFDVASIKRNATNTFAGGPPPNPASGQFAMRNAPVQALVLRGYPLQTMPPIVVGLPGWAESERYDVVAKGKPGATPEEQAQMWRALLTERLKLQAHYETRERAGYDLVLARSDKRLGPQLSPSTLDCTKPPGPLGAGGPVTPESIQSMAMARCGIIMMSNTTSQAVYSGSIPVANLARMMSGVAGRPVVDRTGLDGAYAVSLRFARDAAVPVPPGTSAPPVDDAPSLFTAVQEQLGLKLEPTTIQGQMLVIDHIERPSED